MKRAHPRPGVVVAISACVVTAMTCVAAIAAPTATQTEQDCVENSPSLEACEFVAVGYKENEGPNTRVSQIIDNCNGVAPAEKSIEWSASSAREMRTEYGHKVTFAAGLDSSLVKVGLVFEQRGWSISGSSRAVVIGSTLTASVPPGRQGFVMFRSRRLDVSGYLQATYREPREGSKVWHAPAKGGSSQHVYYPLLLPDGAADGSLWLRTVPCRIAIADAESSTDGVTDTPLPYP